MLLSLPTGASVDGSGRSSVIIDNVTVRDGGTYVCIAENTVGSIRSLSFVRVRGMHLFIIFSIVFNNPSQNLFKSEKQCK